MKKILGDIFLHFDEFLHRFDDFFFADWMPEKLQEWRADVCNWLVLYGFDENEEE